MQEMSHGVFRQVKALREPSLEATYGMDTRANRFGVRWAQTWLTDNLASPVTATLNYEESISRAIRHVLNEQGSCGTFGDAYGNNVEEVLRKYYVYSYKDFEVVKITSQNLMNIDDFWDSPRHAMEYILS